MKKAKFKKEAKVAAKVLTVERMRHAHVLAARKVRVERAQAVSFLKATIVGKWGEDALTSFSTRVATPIACLRTGFPHLDDLLTGEAQMGRTIPGTGLGLPFGRITEVSGLEGSAKTSLILHLIKAAQDAGHVAALIDAEHAVDVAYGMKIGVDFSPERLFFSQPDSAEEALGEADAYVNSGIVKFVGIDSVAGLVPEVELEGDIGDTHVGLQARLMTQAMRKLKGAIRTSGVAFVMINQLRAVIAQGWAPKKFGPPPMKTTGGNALRFFADLRLDTRVVRQIRKGTKVVGLMVRLKAMKNKVAPPFREAYVELRFGEGIVAIHPGDDQDAGDGE